MLSPPDKLGQAVLATLYIPDHVPCEEGRVLNIHHPFLEQHLMCDSTMIPWLRDYIKLPCLQDSTKIPSLQDSTKVPYLYLHQCISSIYDASIVRMYVYYDTSYNEDAAIRGQNTHMTIRG